MLAGKDARKREEADVCDCGYEKRIVNRMTTVRSAKEGDNVLAHTLTDKERWMFT
jgi:hypothetical protein